MATRKPSRAPTKKTRTSNPDRATAAAKAVARSTVSGPAQKRRAAVSIGDVHVAKMDATQALAAEFPNNRNKSLEYGDAGALRPQAGQTATPENPAVTGSTTETTASAKTVAESPASAKIRCRVRSTACASILAAKRSQPIRESSSPTTRIPSKLGYAARRYSRTLSFERKSRTLIMSAFPNASWMHAVPQRTAISSAKRL